MSNDKPPVLKLAQPGYDVKTAGDENLIYSSKWPTLKIYKSGSYRTKTINTLNQIADHDLGFTPVFWYFANTPLQNWLVGGTSREDTRAEFMGPVGDGAVEASNKGLVFQPVGSPAVTGPSRLYYYIFAQDIEKQYNAPTIRVGAVQGARPTRVLKLARPGKDIKSDDLFDYIIHSRARAPLLHSVNPSKGAVTAFTVEHGLGYLPIFFPYVKTSRGTWAALYTGQGGSSSIQSDEQKITFTSAGAQEISIVVLKDPFNVDYTRRVSV